MRLKRVKLDHFRRFTDLEICDIPATARLLMLAGPNGCGKSSLFDGFSLWYQLNSGHGWDGRKAYYEKPTNPSLQISNRVHLEFHDNKDPRHKGAFYFRSAYRNEPEFSLNSLQRLGPVVDDYRLRRMVEGDATVAQNYQRLASQALEDVFAKELATTTIGEFRERVVGELRYGLRRLFPDLVLNSLGNPLDDGTFRFDKGASTRFEYMNLSGGEKAAFDLLLDIFVKRLSFEDAVYCIDEPEAHMNTRLQGALLEELYRLLPEQSQLWIATHSIGMVRRARELATRFPESVMFLDFGAHDFDNKVVLSPSRPTRAFWENILSVALDDMANLVAPHEVVICEGNPLGFVPSKNAGHDAEIYNTIFGDEFPDVKFLAGGNSKDVSSDRLGFLAALPGIVTGISVRRLIDRDDHSSSDLARMAKEGIAALSRRHLEAYVYDDEVLVALCNSVGKPEEAAALLMEKQQTIASSVDRGNPQDDIKSAAGEIYIRTKRRLALRACGNDQMAFARSTLAPLIRPDMRIYAELKRDVFGI